jgi:hypothetical protein
MDIQFWIWLIIIVITLIARAVRKKPEQRPRQEERWDEDSRPEEKSQRPMSFEELLREIQESKETRETPAPAAPIKPYRIPEPAYRPPEPTYQDVDYDDNIGEEAQDLETVTADQTSTDIYERAKQQAFLRPSLEETMKLEDTVIRFGQFKGYETTEEKAPLAGFLAELKDPEGFKKAFIMSEILQRKF